MQRTDVRIYHHLRGAVSSSPARLILALASGKAAVLLAVFAAFKTPDFLYLMSTRWDSKVLENIADGGYSVWWYYHWTPVYPALVKAASFIFGPSWISGLVVTNALSFVFPLILYMTFGFRTALLAELFPTYLVFTTIPYSDVVTLTFLALAVLLVFRGKLFSSSLSTGLAMVNMYNGAWAIPSFFLATRKFSLSRRMLFFALPFAGGLLILLWLKLGTGNPFAELSLEETVWGVYLTDPITQALWLLNVNGIGWFTAKAWNVLSVPLSPPYWFIRNLAFEAFYFFGAYYLLKMSSPQRYFLFAFSLSVSVPLLLDVGSLVISNPRLILAAFPVFYSYSAILKQKYDRVYILVCFALAMGIILVQTFSWFS